MEKQKNKLYYSISLDDFPPNQYVVDSSAWKEFFPILRKICYIIKSVWTDIVLVRLIILSTSK